MNENPMKILYKKFGEKPEEGQVMLSIANIFYLMGQESNGKEINKKSKSIRQQLIKELLND